MKQSENNHLHKSLERICFTLTGDQIVCCLLFVVTCSGYWLFLVLPAIGFMVPRPTKGASVMEDAIEVLLARKWDSDSVSRLNSLLAAADKLRVIRRWDIRENCQKVGVADQRTAQV